jgi:ankyrin repeat protein
MSEKRQSSKRTQQSRHRAQDARDRLPPLYVAVKRNDEAAISRILETHPDAINSVVGEFQSTSLHLACRRGFTNAAKLLIEAGANVNTPDSSLKTPLHWACSGDHVETVRYLLSLSSSKISTTTPDSKRRFPLHLAVAMAPKESVELLLRTETISEAINSKDVHGSTPLHVAVRYHREDAEVLLLAHKGMLFRKHFADAIFNLRPYSVCFNSTPHTRFAPYLDVHVDVTDRRGRTPLHYAAQLGRENSGTF